jgi:subtilisin family serine protease
MRIASVTAATVAAFCLSLGSAQADDSRVRFDGPDAPAYQEGEVIVKYKDDAIRTLSEMQVSYSRAEVVDVKRFSGVFKNFEHLTFDSSRRHMEEVVSELERDPNVEYVQPNYIVYASDRVAQGKKAERTTCHISGIPFPPGCVDREETQPAPAAPEVAATGEASSVPETAEAPEEPEAPTIAQRAMAAMAAAKSTVRAAVRRPAIRSAPAEVNPPKADPSNGSAWGLSKIGATRAWTKQRGSKRVIVAVIDSGVDYNHPDLAGNMWRNPKSRRYSATGVDAQATGISGDIVGWDFVHNDNLPYDDSNHGTHVAGTIGAVGGNGRGVSGVSQKVSLMAVKFLNGSGSGSTSAAIKAIDYAISRGAKVLNNSWGGKASGPNRALRDAIARSERAGALFVAAAGNEGTNNDTDPSYPAAFNLPNMITVAATTSGDGLAKFSNRGKRTVHVAAPGASIYSTLPGGRYGRMSGTSMAAPHVSGAAALLWAAYPNASYREIKQKLLSTGDSLSALAGRTQTGKRINLARAIGLVR